MTNDINRRINEHKNKIYSSFTSRSSISKLIYVETFDHPQKAISREKQLKNWHREWKMNLIKKNNPNFDDLYECKTTLYK